MFRSTLFTVAISAFAAMVLAAPSNPQKRHDDDNENVLDVQDVGVIANVDEALKNAEVANDLNLLSNERNDDHWRDHHWDGDHWDHDDFYGHYDRYDDHEHGYYHFDD
ncbi:hypothetical protein VTP01DRAFT_6126 [Rhizomucor pusillus]|uniref:uncharacterized protein n=1 Tax=Rhizomucor pusillus TaxID=4840 RepID=UPI0037433BAF